MSNLKDITGERFGRLVVLHRVPSYKTGNARWLCQCDCGKQTIVRSGSLYSGGTKSCGCLRSDNFQKLGNARKKEHTDSRQYNIWRSMKQRCHNPNNARYKDYGGRGITVCDEWLNSFEAFYKWSLSSGYRDDLSIDRIDNDKGYFPENCRWATAVEQYHNKRNTVTKHTDPAYLKG